jgi:hypothetical protein
MDPNLSSYWNDAVMQKCFSYVEYINNTTYKVAEWNIQLNFIYFCCRHVTYLCLSYIQDLNFQRHLPWSFIVFNDFRWDAVVRFVDILGMDFERLYSYKQTIKPCTYSLQPRKNHTQSGWQHKHGLCNSSVGDCSCSRDD